MDWDNYRAFLEVARMGSLAAAAAGLDTSVAKLRRQLDALEQRLGLELLERSAQGIRPTPVGARLIAALQPMAQAAGAAALVGEPAGSVSVAALEIFTTHLLPSVFAKLRQTHPHLSIELIAKRWRDDLSDCKADVVVLATPPAAAGLEVRCFGGLEAGLYAHRDYIDAAGAPAEVADLPRFSLIGPESDLTLRRVSDEMGLALNPSDLNFRTDSINGQFSAVMAGVGIGRLFVAQAKAHPELVRVLPAAGNILPGWVAASTAALASPLVRLVFETVAAAMARHAVRPGDDSPASRARQARIPAIADRAVPPSWVRTMA